MTLSTHTEEMRRSGLARFGRMLRKPPHIVLLRVLTEVNTQTDRFRAPLRARGLDDAALLRATESSTLDGLWESVSRRLHAVVVRPIGQAIYERLCPGDGARILAAADAALSHHVDLLGSGRVDLGPRIDWHTDFKTGKTWPLKFMHDLDYLNLDCPSDVKVPWELSRMHWLIPAAQAYLLTGDERYAYAVRDVLDDWIAANPYAGSVNWACAMEVAMRIMTWTFFFHVFNRSQAWSEPSFQSRYLRSLFLHGEFTERYIERSHVNGNHFTADAAGLVCAGLFFGKGSTPKRWASEGWQFLCQELPRQVPADGVNFEASVPYHRLVLELFFLAARYREACGLPVPDDYKDRVVGMARFTMAYSRQDGSSPLLGDADDARALPLGGQPIGDHRYLTGLIGSHWNVPDLIHAFRGPRAEMVWALGPRAAASLNEPEEPASMPSAAFPQAGIFVMRNACDHVFIDCGGVGMEGRGGHGHNDCLSFEATLAGVHVITDCGAYVYTANVEERHRFRSTASHNTPQIDGQELNRFVAWHQLWALHDDAAPELREWTPGGDRDVFVGTHTGYMRLEHPVRPVRTIVLDHHTHVLTVSDQIEGAGAHRISVPLHLAAGVEAEMVGGSQVKLIASSKTFLLDWSSPEDWDVAIEPARVSPSYGVMVPTVRLVWSRSGQCPATLTMRIAPQE
jgi:uncharacterized heparinase superfamily protein